MLGLNGIKYKNRFSKVLSKINNMKLSNWTYLLDSAEDIVDIPSLCYKLPIQIDQDKLIDDFYKLIFSLKPKSNYEEFCVERFEYIKDKLTNQHNIPDEFQTWWSINLTHMDHLVNDERWSEYFGNANMISQAGGHVSKFTQWLDELKNLYIDDIIKTIIKYHEDATGKIFKGGACVNWIAPNSGYEFHVDQDGSEIRYHVPLITNSDVHWLFNHNNEFYKLNMKLGEVWALRASEIVHTVRNNSNVARAHLMVSAYNIE